MFKTSKILMIVLPLTIILFCYAAYEYGYVAWMSAKTDLRDMRELKEKKLFKYVAAVSKKQNIVSTLHFLRPVKATDDEGIINEPVPESAMENLRVSLKDIVTRCGGQMIAEQGIEPVKSGIYMIYEMEADTMLPDTRALNEVVYAIESHTLYMVVKKLDVRVLNPDMPRELAVKIRIAAIGIGR